MKTNATLYINGRFLTRPLTGIPRFSYEMCCALQSLGIAFTVVAPPDIRPEYDIVFPLITIGKNNSHMWEQFQLSAFLRKQGNPLLISFSGLGPIRYKYHICTIHDIAFLRNPEWFSRSYNLIYKYLTPILAKNAQKILTVSEFSKSEIVELLNIKSEKITVIYNAVAKHLLENEEKSSTKERVNERYILSVSSHDPRKNFIRAIEAFNRMNLPDVKLYIIGNADKVFNSQNLYGYQNDKIKILGRVSDEELSSYYRGAELFIYPSLYEGFGIPPLEAMAMGCPVVASDIPSIAEICGDAFLRCDPTDASSIMQAIEKLLNTSGLRNELIQKGNARWQLYGWEKSAAKLKTLLNELEY